MIHFSLDHRFLNRKKMVRTVVRERMYIPIARINRHLQIKAAYNDAAGRSRLVIGVVLGSRWWNRQVDLAARRILECGTARNRSWAEWRSLN